MVSYVTQESYDTGVRRVIRVLANNMTDCEFYDTCQIIWQLWSNWHFVSHICHERNRRMDLSVIAGRRGRLQPAHGRGDVQGVLPVGPVRALPAGRTSEAIDSIMHCWVTLSGWFDNVDIQPILFGAGVLNMDWENVGRLWGKCGGKSRYSPAFPPQPPHIFSVHINLTSTNY